MKSPAPCPPADAAAPAASGGSRLEVPAGRYLEYLSQSALEFISLPPEADVYRHVAVRLHALLGDSVVVVASYEPETREIRQRALVGAGGLLDATSAMAGIPLLGFRHVLNAEAEKEISLGRLVRVEEGLYEALLRSVPRPVTRVIEKMTGIRAIYGMGCVAGGQCLGSILMCLRSDHGMPPAEVVETYIGQASLAMQRRRAETALRESEGRFRTLMEQSPDAYLVMTRDGTICDVNPGACKVTGHARSALLGRSVVAFLDAHELIGKPIRWERLERGDVFTETRRVRHADGRYLVFESRLAPLADGHVLVVGRDITEHRRLEMEVAEVSRREREAVGRDLHDSLGQHLGGLSLLCAGLRDQLAAKGVPEAAEAGRIAALLEASINQAGHIAQGLCVVELGTAGISAALNRLADHLRAVFAVDCRFVQDGEVAIAQDAAAAHLYLIAQESASNAVRHGRAKRIVIELRTRDGVGRLLIRDDGSGFDTASAPAAGLGLRIMRYRAGVIDGTLDVASSPAGTTVTCTFPLAR